MFLHSDLSMHEGFGEFPKENFVHGWVVGFLESGLINVVYKRDDGNYAVLEPDND